MPKAFHSNTPTEQDLIRLAASIKQWGRDLGFQQVGITDTDLTSAEPRLQEWLVQGFHGEMAYMANHGSKRSRPQELIPGTTRVIMLRMDYLPPDIRITETLRDRLKGYISCYALGRDYHKVLRKRVEKLAKQIQQAVGPFSYRVFCDSAPVLEKPLAEKAGLGWQGKHTNIINSKAGSWFFLATLYTDLPLPIDKPATDHCGSCDACIKICPTQAIVGPYQLDARRCISYLTIELRGAIPHNLRTLIGNRIYGCDDCQLVCPWNKFAKFSQEEAFHPRQSLSDGQLLQLFQWSAEDFAKYTEGSAIRRIGYDSWLRNIAVALGNAPASHEILQCLLNNLHTTSELVREHIVWAIDEQKKKLIRQDIN